MYDVEESSSRWKKKHHNPLQFWSFDNWLAMYRPVTRGGARGSDEPPILTIFFLIQLYVLIHSSKSKFIPENIRNSLMQNSTVPIM